MINKVKNTVKNIIMSRVIAAEIQRMADDSHRSFSSQVAFMLEQYIKFMQQGIK